MSVKYFESFGVEHIAEKIKKVKQQNYDNKCSKRLTK